MDTRNLSLGSRWLVAAGLSIIVALSGCGDPGTNVGDEKKKDDDELKARSDLNTIKNPDEKAAAQAFKKAGANVFLDSGTVTDVGFQGGGCDDAMAANLTKTPNVQRLTLMSCSKVTDKSVPAIVALKNLKMAMLTGTGITAAGAKKIQKAVGNGGMVMHPATQGGMMKMMGGPGGAKGGGGGGPGGGPGGGGGRPGGR